MSFLNPFFLLGLAALAAPILVHLVRRTRARRVEFPALVFVRQIPQRTIRRRTLHNLLLLLLRSLALLAVVLAFTRPFFTSGGAASENNATTASVILIDTSLSMKWGEHFAESKRRAEAIISMMGKDERVALMTFDKGYDVVSRLTADKTGVVGALSKLDTGFEGTDYEQALRGAEALFGEPDLKGPKRIIMISDFQRTGWAEANATFKLRDDVRLMLVDVGGDAAAVENVGVTNVEARGVMYGQKYTDKLAVQISNFGEEARARVQLDFRINDQTVEKRELNLAAHESKTIEFTDFNLTEGVSRCVVAVDANDFQHDNQFYFTLRREAPAKGLIVERAARGRSESLYLQSALATDENLPFTFALRSGGAIDPSELSPSSLLILNDAGQLSPALTESLNRFVEDGGRLIIAAGPNTQPEDFNRAFERIAPALLREKIQLSGGESVAITYVKMDHPVFEVFNDGGRLSAARVVGYHRSEPRDNATVLARFEDGSPALVESGAGAKGRVLLFTSTLGTSWSDLPLTPLYLPLVQQMVRYLGEREAVAWNRLGQTFTVARAAAENEPPAVDTPSGARLSERQLASTGQLLVTGREPGFYRLRYSAAPEFAAVNVDTNEGDFSKLNQEEFLAAVTGGGAGASAESTAANQRSTNEETEARQRIWWPLLLVALLLFITEALLARRTRMVKMIG